MMGIWDKASDGSKEGERFYFQMRRSGNDVGFVQGNVGVIFLVHIEIFDKALP